MRRIEVNTTFTKKIEKMAYRSFYDDGLFEIGIGYVFLFIGAGMLRDTGSAMVPFLILPMLFLPKIKKSVIIPRAGLIKISKKRRWNLMKSVLVLTGSVLLNGLLVLMVKNGIFIQLNSGLPWMSILISAKVFLVFTLTGFFLAYDRLYLWAGLLAFAFLVCEMRIHQTGSRAEGGPFLAGAGFIILAFGIIQLFRFLKDNPIPEENSHV